MTFSIAGKTAIVTGAANGVGLAVAQKFVDEGANVVLADIDQEGLQNAAERLKGKGDIRIFSGNTCDRLCVSNLMSTCIEAFNQVDILVNAARVIEETDALDCNDVSVEKLMERNVFANLRLTKAVVGQMCKQGKKSDEGKSEKVMRGAVVKTRGVIVNMSSILASVLRPELMGYSVAVGAVENMTRAMAVSYAAHSVRVNAISFGSIMSGNMMFLLDKNTELRGKIESITPLGWIAGAGEVASAAQFLASDAAQFITGQVLTVDGGRTLRDPISGIVF